MSVQIIDTNFDKELFNSFASHPLQSWQWGEARSAMGIDVLRIGEFEKDVLTKTFQITFHPIPKTKFKIAYIPKSLWPSQETFEFLVEYGKKHNVIFFKFEPNIKKNNFDLKIENWKLKIQPSGHPLFTTWNQVMDLSKTDEELLKNMHPKTRYNIRLAEKKGVVVKEESTDEGFEKFSKLYFETTKRQHYFGHTPEYHKTIWTTLKDNISHILIAYYNDIPLAAYELFYFNKVFYYPYGGSSDLHRNVMAANLIMWEAIKLGKKLGAQSFDLWGSLAPDYDKSNPWAGFTRFKEGYNAEFVEMAGSYDLVVNPLLYKMYGAAHIVRGKLLSWKR